MDTPLPPPPPISWDGLGYEIQFDSPSPEGSKEDDPLGGVGKNEDMPRTWHDVALSIAAELMGTAREQVHTQLGYSTSAVSLSTILSIVNDGRRV